MSDYYELRRTQATLEFVDVYLHTDTRLFVDPRAFQVLRTPWAEGCVRALQEYFAAVLDAIKAEDESQALELLQGLHEPNETRLGLSRNRPRGRGVGDELAIDLYEALSRSEAARTGLLTDLEDTALMVPGIAADRISDITTNVIRPYLLEYTAGIAERYEMALDTVESGPMWDRGTQEWDVTFVKQPTPYGEPLLLVPRSVVRYRLDFDPGDYYRKFVLRFLADREIARNSNLVHTLRDGTRKVYKKDLDQRYRKRRRKTIKDVAIDVTLENPQIFSEFKAARATRYSPPLDFEVFTARAGVPPPDWTTLVRAVTELPPGNTDAQRYHRAVEALLSALFYPSLTDVTIEREIEQGRKRIDISYVNIAVDGFFRWFTTQIRGAPWVSFECKNYSNDPANEALAQLVGRLNDFRGRLGFLVCRRISDRTVFSARCHSELVNNGNYIIGLDDGDLTALVEARRNDDAGAFGRVLRDRLSEVVD